ncbi:RuBisCO large subunit C-terminal-like domain-containing protein [Quisquiliibacterium transsilvanicum]|uniref:Ribulose-bisphosphate carboxylase large chain n=1 Tax=Quisquiliibacterium transsilvanicum TaxID=1549638 RepID=A0A7W8HK26_9BURK|nr:RuBisCO large subunit C-terminal-like domain-containing protein [Quisquiliibacterium transsilvanicum]MBB5272901.1 ribulose-bisphosphate carboxylase large chain [Quisquiliibacterium transsilvanicum]
MSLARQHGPAPVDRVEAAGRIDAVYRVRCAPAAIEARALAIAAEQSVEMPIGAIQDDWIRDEIVARVEDIEAEPEAKAAEAVGAAGAAQQAWRVTLSLDARTVGTEPGQLMNMLFGNSSLQPDVELIDARLPAALLDTLPGPAFGVDGLRALVGAPRRALTCTALKPQGLPPERLAALAGSFARAGIDFIKDDHGIADQAYAPFAQRVAQVQRAVTRANAETGGRSVYAPSLSGGARSLAQQLRIARDEGVRCVLACPLLIGVATFAELVRERGDLAILAHPALAGAARIAPALLLGRLVRLFGADATIFPNFGGRFSYGVDTCRAIADAARGPLGRHRATMPVPAGGMSVARVEEMLDEFGADVMLLIGGNLLEAGAAMPARAREFVERVQRASAR